MRIELWAGLVHTRALPESDFDPGNGAFVNVVAPARDPATFEAAARRALEAKGLAYVSAEHVKSFERRLEGGQYSAELVELAVDAAATGTVGIGTPHVYPADAPDADMDWTAKELLRDAEKETNLVDLSRVEGFDTLRGYVVGIGSDLLVLHEVSNDITLDGHSILRLGDVADVLALDEEHFAAHALKLLGLEPSRPHVDVTSLESVFRSLAEREELATIALEKVAPDVAYIGRVERVESNGVLLGLIGPDARWGKADFYAFSEITRVSFGGRYEAALLMVARDTERADD
jgi:hypothetical protein